MRLILYSKPGCHLCEGLQEKLEQIHSFKFELEVRDITSREDWFEAYQYEIPVLYLIESEQGKGEEIEEILHPTLHTSHSGLPLPRPSPRATVQQVERMLQKYLLKSSE